MPSAPQPVIEFSHVSKRFGGNVVLKEINLAIWPGTICGIIGPSGAGKTTLLRLLIGFYAPSAGRILIEGMEQSQLPPGLFGFGTQDDSFYDELTCQENLDYFGRLYGLSRTQIEENAALYLNLVGLAQHRDSLAKTLSGGMKRRLDLAIALIHSPRILILDEPTAGLDPKLRKQVWGIVQQIKAHGITVIVTSHLLTEMEHFCDQVAILYDGRIIEAGAPEALKSVYSRNEEVQIETAEGRYDILYRAMLAQGVPVVYARLEDHYLIVYTPDAERAIRGALDAARMTGQHLLDLDVNRPSLNEVFEALINQQEQMQLLRTGSQAAAQPALRSHERVLQRRASSFFHALAAEARELLERRRQR